MRKHRSLVLVLMMIVLCATIIVGSTMAYYTDEVPASENLVTSGDLEVKFEWADKLGEGWQDAASAGPIFNQTHWEPNFTTVKYIRVSNPGDMPFQYELNVVPTLVPENGVNLMDVIDVYFGVVDENTPAITAANYADELQKVGNLTALLKNENGAGYGIVLPKDAKGTLPQGAIAYNESVTVCIALHMQHTAGNEYMNRSVGEGFNVQLAATQYTYDDAFGTLFSGGAQLPEVEYATSKTVSVTPDQNGCVPYDIVFESDTGVTAVVPKGAKMEAGARQLILIVYPKAKSDANLSLQANEVVNAWEVKVEGLADDNTLPVRFTLPEAMQKGLNIGNYSLYHVENGTSVPMTRVDEITAASAHNSFSYNPATGDMGLALATFSEIAIVSDTTKAWEGKFDYTWYDANATELTIANADQLAAFGAIVGGMNGQTKDSFAGKTVKLISDINLGDAESKNNPDIIFYPIGYYNSEGTYERTNTAITSGLRNFEGTFDGNGHTISNFYHNTWEMKGDHNWYTPEEQYYRDGMGLFGRVYKGTVKNLTVDNFSSDGEIATTGVIAAYADGATFENIAVTNCNPRVYNIGNGGIVGCVGWYAKEANLKTTFTNITVDNSNKISALWGSYDVACGGIVGQYYPTSGQTSAGEPKNGGIDFVNCHVSAQMDVYNDVCGNYQYYAYRYAGMMIGSIRENETIDGRVYPKMDGITAKDCTVNYGDWVNYYYCELMANSIASYTHDYQFSRLTQIKSIEGKEITYLDETTGTVPETGRYNYVIVGGEHDSLNAKCYHFVDGSVWEHDTAGKETIDGVEVLVEDKQHVHLPFNQLFTGYGWGVTSKGLKDLEGVTQIDVVEGKIEGSIDKFVGVAEGEFFETGKSVKAGELFEEKSGISPKVLKEKVCIFVSPVGDDSTVSGTYTPNADDWTQGTLTFSGTGAATVIITDYYFCTPTIIEVNIVARQSIEKFVAKDNLEFVHTTEGGTIIKTLGDVFAAIDGVEIDSENVVVTNSSSEHCEYERNGTDWTQSTLMFKGVGEVILAITDQNYCNVTEAKIIVSEPVDIDKFETKFDGEYLYRVGNQNAVSWEKLFSAFEDLERPVGEVSLTLTTVAGDATGTVEGGNIRFTGTGVVQVSIDDNAYTNAKPLYLEVVDAFNVTAYSELKEQNSVLLNDITMSNGGTYRLTGNKVLYGNGFTFDVTQGAYAGVQYDYMSYVIYLENSCLDNIQIKGAVYPEVGATKEDNYNRAIIMTNGNCKITNSYISNGASPIRNGGDLELINTTLKGGAYANLDLRNGHLILNNVTTVNQVNANDKHNDETVIVGLGIVVYQEGGTEDLKITIRNNLTQYNYLSEEQANQYLTSTYAKAIKNVVFGNDFTAYKNDEWVNLGIVSMNNYFAKEDLVDERTDHAGYFGTAKTVTLLGESRDCYVYSFKPTSAIAPEYAGYITVGQGIIEPNAVFDFFEKNYQAKIDGSNDYCYEDGGTVYISMDEGDTFKWDTSILALSKFGQELNYNVKMEDKDYTGETISFNTEGTYEIVYSYTDEYNYKLVNGVVTSHSEEYMKTLTVEVAVVKAAAKHAEFSFGANGTAYKAKTVLIGDKTYVMPDVNATVSEKIGSTTVSGTTVYYPITEMYTSDGETAHTGSWYACFPIFKDAVQIIDYADGGTGDPVTYNQTEVTTVEKIPATLKATNPTSAFLYQMNATNYPPPTDPTAVSGAVCYTCNRNGLTGGNERVEMTIVAEYTYTDNAGMVYYYYIGYHCDAQTKGSCVAPDTLFTMADGTQKRADELAVGDVVRVFNHITGQYEAAPIIFNTHFDEEEREYEVLHLQFANGKEVKIVAAHGFYDMTLMQYVYITNENYQDYIGHEFYSLNNDGTNGEAVKLEKAFIETEMTRIFCPVSYFHMNSFANGFLNTPNIPGGITGLVNYFEYDADMKYNEEAMQRDIEKYGVYTYDDFKEYISEAAFNSSPSVHLKVAVGKGMITFEQILDVIDYLLSGSLID